MSPYGTGLIAARREIIEQIATTKFEVDEGKFDRRVLITALDIES